MQSKGVIEARQLQLVAAGSPSPRPVRIDYQASYQLSSGTGKIDNTRLGSGAAKLAVSGSFDNHPKIMQLDLRIRGKDLPVDDLQPLLPAFGVVLPKDSHLSGGSLGVNLRARGPLDKLVISGPVTLDNSRLAGFSLGSKLGGALSKRRCRTDQGGGFRRTRQNYPDNRQSGCTRETGEQEGGSQQLAARVVGGLGGDERWQTIRHAAMPRIPQRSMRERAPGLPGSR